MCQLDSVICTSVPVAVTVFVMVPFSTFTVSKVYSSAFFEKHFVRSSAIRATPAIPAINPFLFIISIFIVYFFSSTYSVYGIPL